MSISSSKAEKSALGASTTGYSDSLRELKQLYVTYRTMESIKHSEKPLENHFCVNLQVKMRYIDPLVATCVDKDGKSVSSAKPRLSGVPISSVSPKAKKIIEDFLSWHDKPWGCVPLASL